MEQYKIKHPLIKVFFTSFVLFLISILPILIASKGVYVWCGDYDNQSIVFIEHIHRLLHTQQGIPSYDWTSLLGLDFLAYGEFLFSPFNWILYILPYKIVPYAHSFVMAIKVGFAAVTAYMYCRQYVKTDRSAFICGLLYAFSGFQLFNMVYQFSDRYLMFPLLLYSFDQLVINKKPFCFAALLALNNIMSLYFCWIMCVCIAIYYIVRTATGSFPRLNLKLFLRLAVECGCGVCVGMFTMLPGIIELSHNDRVSDTIFGHSLLAYETDGVILRNIQSLFFSPDQCHNGFYFKDVQLSTSPPELYIPLFTVIGVMFIWRRNKRAWYSMLLLICAIIGCIPLLNSVFSAFNNSYYARWYFFPLLIMIMMTGMYIDDIENNNIKKEFIICSVIMGFWIVYGVYTVFFEKPVVTDFGLKNYWIRSVVISVLGYMTIYLMGYGEKRSQLISFNNIKSIVCVFCLAPFLCFAVSLYETDYGNYIPNEVSLVWNDFQPVKLESDEFYRTSSVSQMKVNTPMTWEYPTVSVLNSSITAETCDFFESAGVKCAQATILSRDDYAICSFLSVKYDLYCNLPMVGNIEIEPEYLKKFSMPGFEQTDVFNRYIAYKNSSFIPMGYTFDYYLRIESDGNEYNSEDDDGRWNVQRKDEEAIRAELKTKQKLLLKAIWLTDEQIIKYGSILDELPEERAGDLSYETYTEDCKDRAATACYEFAPNNKGFIAKTNLPKENLVFFSVPYTKGFTAYVDGRETEIEKVFNGLCAVYVPKGDHRIEFRYETPGFKIGCIISLISTLVLVIYTSTDLIIKHRQHA